jgi:hypothetical protein
MLFFRPFLSARGLVSSVSVVLLMGTLPLGAAHEVGGPVRELLEVDVPLGGVEVVAPLILPEVHARGRVTSVVDASTAEIDWRRLSGLPADYPELAQMGQTSLWLAVTGRALGLPLFGEQVPGQSSWRHRIEYGGLPLEGGLVADSLLQPVDVVQMHPFWTVAELLGAPGTGRGFSAATVENADSVGYHLMNGSVPYAFEMGMNFWARSDLGVPMGWGRWQNRLNDEVPPALETVWEPADDAVIYDGMGPLTYRRSHGAGAGRRLFFQGLARRSAATFELKPGVWVPVFRPDGKVMNLTTAKALRTPQSTVEEFLLYTSGVTLLQPGVDRDSADQLLIWTTPTTVMPEPAGWKAFYVRQTGTLRAWYQILPPVNGSGEITERKIISPSLVVINAASGFYIRRHAAAATMKITMPMPVLPKDAVPAATPPPIVDWDKDGMADTWEQEQLVLRGTPLPADEENLRFEAGLVPNADPDEDGVADFGPEDYDPDGDGLDNRSEYLLGGDPLAFDAPASPRAEWVATGATTRKLVVHLPTTQGCNYRIQYCALGATVWTNLLIPAAKAPLKGAVRDLYAVRGTGDVVTVDALAVMAATLAERTPRFFRVLALPPTDTDGDNLSDIEEEAYGTDPNKADTDGDLMSDGLELNTADRDPLDFFDAGSIRITSGNRQFGLPGEMLRVAIQAEVKVGGKLAPANLPVNFVLTQGNGLFFPDAYSSNLQTGEVLTVKTDAKGIVRAFLHVGPQTGLIQGRLTANITKPASGTQPARTVFCSAGFQAFISEHLGIPSEGLLDWWRPDRGIVNSASTLAAPPMSVWNSAVGYNAARAVSGEAVAVATPFKHLDQGRYWVRFTGKEALMMDNQTDVDTSDTRTVFFTAKPTAVAKSVQPVANANLSTATAAQITAVVNQGKTGQRYLFASEVPVSEYTMPAGTAKLNHLTQVGFGISVRGDWMRAFDLARANVFAPTMAPWRPAVSTPLGVTSTAMFSSGMVGAFTVGNVPVGTGTTQQGKITGLLAEASPASVVPNPVVDAYPTASAHGYESLLYIGGVPDPAASNYMGLLGDVLVYDGSPSATDRERLQYTLASLYRGISMADADRDGMPDWWEFATLGTTLQSATDDLEPTADPQQLGDGLNNLAEYLSGTHPGMIDTDGDTLSDYEEVVVRRTNPGAWDSDFDLLPDSAVAEEGMNALLSSNGQTQVQITLNGQQVTVTAGLAYLLNQSQDAAISAMLQTIFGSTEPGLQYLTLLAQGKQAWVPDPNDQDHDRVYDAWESAHALNPLDPFDGVTDPDEDGLSNVEEFLYQNLPARSVAGGLDPHNDDTDEDQLKDGWEVEHSINALSDEGPDGANGDLEPLPSTLPAAVRQRLIDNLPEGTLPYGDGLTNYDEQLYGTNPRVWDTDDDTLPDGWEVRVGLSPLEPSSPTADLEGDGLKDRLEFIHDTLPNDPDTDEDTMPDGWEVLYKLDPTDYADAEQDADKDGFSNATEYANGTNPGIPDPGGNPGGPGGGGPGGPGGPGSPAPAPVITLKSQNFSISNYWYPNPPKAEGKNEYEHILETHRPNGTSESKSYTPTDDGKGLPPPGTPLRYPGVGSPAYGSKLGSLTWSAKKSDWHDNGNYISSGSIMGRERFRGLYFSYRATRFRLESDIPVPQDVTQTFLRIRQRGTFQNVENLDGVLVNTEVLGTVQLTIPKGQKTSQPQNCISPLPDGTPPGSTTNTSSVGTVDALSKVSIEKVYETDQEWNEAPNPRRPDYWSIKNSSHDAETLYKRLYCAIEPESGHAEITVQISGSATPNGKLMCCLEYNNNLTTPAATFDQSGKAKLNITPLGLLIDDCIHTVRVGYDANDNGSLESSELVPLEPKPFSVGIAESHDLNQARFVLNLGSAITAISGHVVSAFLNKDNVLYQSTAPHGSTTRAITAKDPTLIAGSPYSSSSGGGASTIIPKFHVPAGSDDSDYIAEQFAKEANRGLHDLVNNVWNKNATVTESAVGSSNGSTAWVTLQLAGESVNFYYTDSLFPLTVTFGTASCSAGTARIFCERTANGIAARTIELNCTIEDLYDFDVTRPNNTLSRKGSIAQLGWESTRRPEGRIFFMAFDVTRTYTHTTVINGTNVMDFFNQNSGLYVPPTNPGS